MRVIGIVTGTALLIIGLIAGSVGAQEAEMLEQWAVSIVDFTSNGPGIGYSPHQLIGEPSGLCEYSEQHSWTPEAENGGTEWAEVVFSELVYPFGIEIYESLNPGVVTTVLVRDEGGEWTEVWSGTDTTRSCPGVLKIQFPSLPEPTRVVRVEMNTSLVPGPNFIDAVKLIGFSTGEGPLETVFTQVSKDKRGKPELFTSFTFVDYDHDGWPDMLGQGATDDYYILLHNEGNGTFRDRSALLSMVPIYSNSGGKFGDYDNDGDLDLFLTGGSIQRPLKRPDVLLRNDRGRFIDVTLEAAASLLDSQITATAIWWDYDRDSWLDLYLGHGHQKEVIVSSPNELWRNLGNGTFVAVTAEAGLDLNFESLGDELGQGTSAGMISGDFNDDGWPDLYVPVIGNTNRLFLNDGTGSFWDATTSVIGGEGIDITVDVGDFNNDSHLDIFQPAVWGHSQEGEWRSYMLMNLGEGDFLDVTDGVGLGRANGSLFPNLEDFDNDGDLDLLIGIPLLLFVNDGSGHFTERSFESGLSGVYSMADYDGDGSLDVWFDKFLFLNRGNDNHFLRIELVGTESNRDGLGTRVIARTGNLQQMREFSCGNGWNQDEMLVHFGLGEHPQVDELELRWLSGQVDLLTNIPADQTIRVIEGTGEWYPAEKTIWTIEPPASLEYGRQVDFVAVAKPALFEPLAKITRITGDLSSIGGPEAVPLENLGDGRYKLEANFIVSGTSDLRDVEIFIEQETSLGPYWINLSRNIDVTDDPNTAVMENYIFSLPSSFALDQNYPNPFNSTTVIRFTLPEPQLAELAIYNLAGQQVAKLMSGERQAGTYTVHWDGRDDNGRELASGVYLYRLLIDNGSHVETRKLVLVR